MKQVISNVFLRASAVLEAVMGSPIFEAAKVPGEPTPMPQYVATYLRRPYKRFVQGRMSLTYLAGPHVGKGHIPPSHGNEFLLRE